VRASFLALTLTACGGSHPALPDAGAGDAPSDAAPDAPPVAVTITSTVNSTRFAVRDHMLASAEMQISGEPLAEAMGRNLGGYSRNLVPPDIYVDPVGVYGVDLPGFSTGVESYEYSKQPMNNLAFEAGAGTSLAHAPLVNGLVHLVSFVQQFAERSNAWGKWVFPAGTFPQGNAFGDVNPTGAGTGDHNPVGWPGMWPTAHVFASFDPAIDATGAQDLQCTIASDDNPNEGGGLLVSGDYECDASSLHLRDRATQIEPAITPGADGFSAWKYGLWTINYLQVMHDGNGGPVVEVPEDQLAQVGVPGNQVAGIDDMGFPTPDGTFIGSSDIEGFQAAMFLLMTDARADDWLLHLTTSDGETLSGFPSLAGALAYDEAGPLRWFPGRVTVTETDDGSGFGQPSYALGSASSDLMDLVGVAMGYAEVYALTDTANAIVGGSQTARVYFDGDPFASDDQLANGEPTLHDRTLAMIRVAIVNMDRLHVDPASGLLVDDVMFTGATPVRGHTLSTTSAAYTVIGLRTALRSLSSQLQLYSNNTPDTAVVYTPLDALPLHAATGVSFSQRAEQLLRAHAELLYDHLTDASGRAYTGWDVAANAPVDQADTLDAHTAAIRGLFAAYLSTGETRYRDRAMAVFARMEAVFYDADARIYTATPAPADDVEYTPLRFALLQSALRDIYELVATRPGFEAMEPALESKLGRLNKLVLNGWDDRDRDRHVDWPDECANVVDGLPRGGLQMAERTLTGETGRLVDEVGIGSGSGNPPTSDRESDCVPEVDDAHLPAALAASVTFHLTRQP
jgi:hypothetical protein